MNKDLTIGKPIKVLWAFCMPMFLSMIFQQFYNVADSLIAGRFIGENALAAVGNSYQIILIYLAFAFGCNVGLSVVVATYFGAKDNSKLKTSISTGFIWTLFLIIILMTFGIIFSDRILLSIKTPIDVFYDSKIYLNIYIFSTPFMFFYNMTTGIFSAMGDSKTPFKFLLVSSITNIFMNVVFVKYLHLGVMGLSLATLICQGISCIASMVVVYLRIKKLETVDKPKLFSFDICKTIISIALPSTLQQASLAIGSIFIQGIVNSFGAAVMASFAATIKLNNFFISSLMTVGNGFSTYVAQNLGANKIDRVNEGLKAGLLLALIIDIPIFILYFFFGRNVIAWFIENPSEDTIKNAVFFLKVLSTFYFMISAKLVVDGILRGSGQMFQFIINTIPDIVLRVVLAYILSKMNFGSYGIWLSWPVGWIVSTIIAFACYLHGDWKKSIIKK